MEKERRREYRFATQTNVDFAGTQGVLKNVSLHGMFVETAQPATLGETVTFTLATKPPFTVTGRVVDTNGGLHVEVADEALKPFIAEAVLPKIEGAVTRAWKNVEQVLAFVNAEPEAPDTAPIIEPTSWHSTLILERAATATNEALPVMREMETVLKAALTLGGTPDLERFWQRFAKKPGPEQGLLEQLRVRQEEIDQARQELTDFSRSLQERQDLELSLNASQAREERLQSELREMQTAKLASEADGQELRTKIARLQQSIETQEQERQHLRSELQLAFERASQVSAKLQEQDTWSAAKAKLDADQHALLLQQQALEQQHAELARAAQITAEEQVRMQTRAKELAEERDQLGRDWSELGAKREETFAMQKSIAEQQTASPDADRIAGLESERAQMAAQVGELGARVTALQKELQDSRDEALLQQKKMALLNEQASSIATARSVSQNNARQASSMQEELLQTQRAIEQEKAEINQRRIQLELDRQVLQREAKAIDERKFTMDELRSRSDVDMVQRGQGLKELEEARQQLQQDQKAREDAWAALQADRAAINRERATLDDRFAAVDAQRKELLEQLVGKREEPTTTGQRVPPQRLDERPPPSSSRTIIWAGASAVMVIVIAAMFILRPQPTAAPAPTPVAVAPAPTPAPEQPLVAPASMPLVDEMVDLKPVDKKKKKPKTTDQLFDSAFK